MPQAARKLNLKNGEKVPVQRREYRIDSSKIDKEKRTVEILFSTDEPAERWFGDETLDHSPGACDLSRLNDGGAFLKDHDSRQQIGVHESATISIVDYGAGKKRGEGRAVVRFAPETNKLAEQEFQDLIAGVRTKISVGYAIRAMKLVAEDDIGNESWLITKWEPLENSLVAIPLDKNCAAGRENDLEEFPVSLDLSFRSIEKSSQERENSVDINGNRSQKRESGEQQQQNDNREKVMTEAERLAKEAADKEAARQAAQAVQDGIKAARQREREILDICSRANVPEDKKEAFETRKNEAIELAATDEKAVSEFQTYVFKNFWGAPKTVDTPSGAGNGDVRVVGERALSLGRQFVESKEFASAMGRRGLGKRNCEIETDYAILGIRGKVTMAQRAGFTSSDLSAVNVQIQTGIVGLGVQRLTIMDLLAPGATGAAAIIYPRENTFGSVDGVAVAAGAMPRAKAVGERGLKPNWEPDLTTENAPVKKIAITTKVPDEFMADFPQARSFIDERLPFMVDTETEYQLLYGDGLDNNLKGIFSTSGIQTRVVDTTSDTTVAASLKKGLTDIRVGSFFEPDGYAFHPYDWETASLLKDTQGRFLAGGPFYIPYTAGVYLELYTFWGKPCVVSTAVTYQKPVAGCWRLGAQYFVREGMRLEMTNSNEDDFRRNLIMIRAEHRLGLATYRPVSFLEFQGFPART